MSDEEPVVAGDWFLRTEEPRGGQVFEVDYVDASGVDLPGYGWSQESTLASAGHGWRRVPAGYVVPTHAMWVADVERLLAARDKMAADPKTGTKGVDDCILEMARMAGIEVAT